MNPASKYLDNSITKFLSNDYWHSKSKSIFNNHWKLFAAEFNSSTVDLLTRGFGLYNTNTEPLINFFTPKAYSYIAQVREKRVLASSFNLSTKEICYSLNWFNCQCNTFKQVMRAFYQGEWYIQTIRIFTAISTPTIDDFKKPSSYYWHRDSVGHAIKLWIPIKIRGNSPPYTSFIDGSNIIPPIPQEWEMLRAHQDNETMKKGTQLVNNYLEASKYKFSNKNFLLRRKPDQAFYFDTNTIHKGVYLSEEETERVVLEFQFNSRSFGHIMGFQGEI